MSQNRHNYRKSAVSANELSVKSQHEESDSCYCEQKWNVWRGEMLQVSAKVWWACLPDPPVAWSTSLPTLLMASAGTGLTRSCLLTLYCFLFCKWLWGTDRNSWQFYIACSWH